MTTDHLHPSDSDAKLVISDEARYVLELPIVQAAFQKVAQDYQRMWIGSEPDQADVREEAYKMLRVLTDFRKVLTTALNTGKMIKSKKALETAQRTRLEEFDIADGRRDFGR